MCRPLRSGMPHWTTTRITAAVAGLLLLVGTIRAFTTGDPCSKPDNPFAYCIERRYSYVLAGGVAAVAIVVAALIDRRFTASGRRGRWVVQLVPPILLAVVGGWLVLI
jgi:hypothetical protein